MVCTADPTPTHRSAAKNLAVPHSARVWNHYLGGKVLTYDRALLTSTPEGLCRYLHADLRDPAAILASAGEWLDLDRPVGLVLVAVVHHLVDDDQAAGVVKELVGALPGGSCMALVHATADFHGDSVTDGIQSFNAGDGIQLCTRTREQVTAFFDGLDLVDPGVVNSSRWRPVPTEAGRVQDVPQWAGVAWKPR